MKLRRAEKVFINCYRMIKYNTKEENVIKNKFDKIAKNDKQPDTN